MLVLLFRTTSLAKEKKKASEIARLLNVPRRTIYDCLKRLEETGSIDDRRRSGRPKTATSGKIVKKICDKIRYHPKRSMRHKGPRMKRFWKIQFGKSSTKSSENTRTKFKKLTDLLIG